MGVERLTLHIAKSSWTSKAAGSAAGSGSAVLYLIDPLGNSVQELQLPASGAADLDFQNAASSDGTWTLRLDPNDDTTGSITFSLSAVTDVSGP